MIGGINNVFQQNQDKYGQMKMQNIQSSIQKEEEWLKPPSEISKSGNNANLNLDKRLLADASAAQQATNAKIQPKQAYQCQTCENRKYQDQSDDSGVSFQTPTKVDPKSAAAAVKSHEMEHVSREQVKAKQDNRQVVFQSVQIHTAICPECGKTYVAGGTTRTVTKGVSNQADKFSQIPENEQENKINSRA